jgi:hypothetical protein
MQLLIHMGMVGAWKMNGPKFSRLTRGLRWVILVIIAVTTLAGCPSPGPNAGPTDQSTQTSAPPGGGAVTNEGVLNSPAGCGTSCSPPPSP